ncbi:hypothetical protein HDE_05562 [Halotydeus destructor]|nr:hypothetical protein HDE_05562 [Halotydeus destructor]
MDETECFTVLELMSKPAVTVELIGRRVRIETKSKVIGDVQGYLYAVDPVDGHLILVNFSGEDEAESTIATQIILNDSVKVLNVLKEEEDKKCLFERRKLFDSFRTADTLTDTNDAVES